MKKAFGVLGVFVMGMVSGAMAFAASGEAQNAQGLAGKEAAAQSHDHATVDQQPAVSSPPN